MKVSQEERTAGKPQLTPDRVGGAEVFIGTVGEVKREKSRFEGKGDQYAIFFEEAPDLIFRLNVTGLNVVCEQIGDDTDGWVGERIPLVKTRAGVGGKTNIVYWVAESKDWAALLRGQPAAAKKRTAARQR